jgi:hypothetical protein
VPNLELAHLAAQERCNEFDEIASLRPSHRSPPRAFSR